MILSEIIQRIHSLYNKGAQSDDSRLTNRHIYNKILTVRNKLIREQSNKKQKINQWNYQTLSCVELEKAPLHECNCISSCEVLKTKQKFPKPLTNLNSHLIDSVTSLNGSIIYSEINWTEKKYKNNNKYTSEKPDYYIKNDYLYVTHKSSSKIISVTAIFEDPFKAAEYPSYCGNTSNECDNFLDKDFPIDSNMIENLIQISSQELILLFSQNKEDLTNDSKDSIVQNSK